MGLGKDGVVKGKKRDGVSVCGGGYFADLLCYWFVQMLGEGQPQTMLSPAVGKSSVTKGEEGGGGRYVF